MSRCARAAVSGELSPKLSPKLFSRKRMRCRLLHNPPTFSYRIPWGPLLVGFASSCSKILIWSSLARKSSRRPCAAARPSHKGSAQGDLHALTPASHSCPLVSFPRRPPNSGWPFYLPRNPDCLRCSDDGRGEETHALGYQHVQHVLVVPEQLAADGL